MKTRISADIGQLDLTNLETRQGNATMKHIGHKLTIAVLSVGALLMGSDKLEAAPYAFSVDMFETTGNLPGTHVNDFNDGAIGPDWEIDDPTVVESGEHATFSNPGITQNMSLGNLNISAEMSYISTNSYLAVDGQGNFSGTSIWSQTIPGLNQFFVMGIDVEEADEDISIGLANFNEPVANYFGITSGLSIFFIRAGDVGAGDFDVQSYSIDSSDITDSIRLRISFDDSTNQFTGGFSLDGSSPDQDLFSGVAPNSLGDGFTWSLGAESWDVTTVPIPGAIWLFGTGLFAFWRMLNTKHTMR
jgi:hypothetical protein